MKKVWFVSQYTMPPQYEPRVKTLKYAHYLNEWGYKTKLFSCSVMHDYDVNLIEGKEKYIEKKYDDLEFVHINCIRYGSSFSKRIVNHLQFAYRFCKIANKFELPDVIVATDLNCINFKPICKFCKKHGIKLIADIRDLWPFAFVCFLGFSEKNPLIQWLYQREKKMYQLSDAIIFSIEGGKDYILEKGWDKVIDFDKVHYINNGIDLEEFNYNQEHYQFADKDLENSEIFKVVYVGTIREANNISALIDTAKILKESQVRDIKILIFGDGDQKTKLAEEVREKGIDNVIFKGHVEKKYIPYILGKSNLNILNYKPVNIAKYGGSQNKLFEYFASGKPTISNMKMGHCLLAKYGAGTSLENKEKECIAQEILKYFFMKKDDTLSYVEICKNAKKAAEDYDFKKLTLKLSEIIENEGNIA